MQVEKSLLTSELVSSVVSIRVFYKHTMLPIMALLPTLYCHIYIYSFLHYLQCAMLVKVKIDVRGYKRIVLQDCKLGWSSLFLRRSLVTLPFLYFGEFVKNFIVDHWDDVCYFYNCSPTSRFQIPNNGLIFT